ncbi:MAG: DegT/DnrJ/EryC1/StrS family aminotransferase [Thermoplasmatota archaeon]
MIPVTRTTLPPLPDYLALLQKAWDSRWITNHGELHNQLEADLRAHLRSPPVRLLSNGTIAIHIALRALRLKGEVITTPFTFSATTNAIVWEGLTPVFADVDPRTHNLDPADVERKITDRTTGILAVHVYGNPCDTVALEELAQRHGLKVIYDAAHAFGVEHQGRSVLDWGDLSTLSFHATKVFHTVEGGAAVASDPALLEQVALMRNNGIRNEVQVLLPGTNAKLSEMHAAMGLALLPGMEERIAARRRLHEQYRRGLAGAGVEFQHLVATRNNYAYMPIVLPSNEARERLHHALLAKDIKSRRYFYPLTSSAAYFPPGTTQAAKVPVAASLSDRVLCLPMYAELETAEADQVIEETVRILAKPLLTP